MQSPNFFLRTKLLPPRPVSEFLFRPRLTDKLKSNLDSIVTLIAADAGSGKTTLIADFIRRQKKEFVWYQLDHTDADPFVFLGYITQGIKKFSPDFGETILSYLNDAKDDLLQHPERAVDLLINEIFETLEQPFILVLDDYHHIGTETNVHKFVDRLLKYSAEMIHLIITTRDLPPLAIMRHRSKSDALVIDRDDLLFTDEEVRELFRKTLNIELKDEEIAEYRQRTHGWITALQLVRQVAEQEIYSGEENAQINLREMLRQSEKDIFDYFAEEVFAGEPEEVRNLLLHLSLLESMPLDVCSRLYPEMRCAALLPELVDKNVFLTVAGDENRAEEYRLHPLFRDFLQRRLRSEIGLEKLLEEKNRIAEFFLADKKWDKALPFLLQAENYEKAAEIVAEKGGEWIAGKAIITFKRLSEKIPLKFLDKFPRSHLHKAEVARLQGETEKSINILNHAVGLLHKNKDKPGEAEALHSLASLARRKGDCAEAFEYLEKAEKLVGEDSETFVKCANTRGLCLIAQGAWAAAEHQFRYALKIAEQQNNESYIRLVTHNLALPIGFRGDFGEALHWLKKMFDGGKSKTELPQESIAHLNVARLHLYRGEFEETEKHLEKSLELCQLYNLKSLRGEIFETYANFYRDKKDFRHAGEFYERALKSYQDAKINIATRELDDERARFYLLRGDTAKARALLEKLLEARKDFSGEIGIQTVKMILNKVRLAEGETENLAKDLEEITKFFHEQNLYFEETISSLLLAQTYFAAGERKEMFAPLQRTLDLTARYDYEHWLKGEIEQNPAIFKDADVIEKLPIDLRESIAEIKMPEKVEKIVVEEKFEPVTDLTVKLLGHVDVYRDKTKPFAQDAWTTKRARDIFCYIASSSFRRAEKDVLIDVFWREEDFSAVEKNFHPTISHIRKALNSKQSFKQNFLVFRDGAYQLNPEMTYFIDTEEFEKHIEEAEKAKKAGDSENSLIHLEKAHELYRGEFMSGSYDDWAEDKRFYFSEQFSRVVGELAEIYLEKENWAKALQFTNEILQEDPYREDQHRRLLKILAAQGKRNAVIREFEKFEKLLDNELGVTPEPETLQVYQKLIN